MSGSETEFIHAGAVIAAWRNGLRPDLALTVSEWADRHRVLSSKASPEPGPWRTSRAPYLKEIMDALSPMHPARRVVFMKSAQVGGTECGNNWIGYVIHHSPSPMMIVQPTTELAKRFSRQKLDPLIEETLPLRQRVAPARSRDSGNRQLSKDFPGGCILMTGANSSVGLRQMTARFLFFDEVDAYPRDVSGEGDPIALAEARTQTYGWRQKIFLVSTPTIAGMSRIEREYLATDQRRYFVPCPHCGHMQWLKFERLLWEKNRPETARYMCEGCGCEVDESNKPWMLAEGQWRATAEAENPNAVGFHISALYAPTGWKSWSDVAREWLRAQGDAEAIKTFKNTVLGETWQESGDAPEWQRLYDRREVWEPETVPAGGLLLTCGVDVQRDRLECSVWAWGSDRQSWLIEHVVLQGNPFERAVWDRLEAFLDKRWRHESGVMMPIVMTAIDSSDGATTAEVYSFVRRQFSGRVIAVKGQDVLRAALGRASSAEATRNGQKIGGVKVWPVGSSFLKAETYGWLKLERPTEESGDPYPPGYVHLPVHVATEEYCRQLTAEQLVSRATKAGFKRLEWIKTRERNEALDCRVYARAAAAALNVDLWSEAQWEVLRESMDVEGAVAPRSLTIRRVDGNVIGNTEVRRETHVEPARANVVGAMAARREQRDSYFERRSDFF